MADVRRDVEELHPLVREAVRKIRKRLHEEGLPFEVYEAFRLPSRQRALLAKKNGVTGAGPWQSFHQYGLAVDFVLKENGHWNWETKGGRLAMWQRMNQIGRKYGMRPLSFELAHLQLDGVELSDLRAGRYPPGGDESWAGAIALAIRDWPKGAPPQPRVDGERPPLGLPAPDWDEWEPSGGDLIPWPWKAPEPEGVEMLAFERAQAILKGYEGGYSNDPDDPGGPTNFGITHTTLARWRKVGSVSAQEVKSLTYEEAKRIYFALYWSKLRCGALPGPLAMAVYNIGVHCGVGTGARFLQRAANRQGAGLKEDGDIGPRTLAAVAKADLGALIRQTIDYYAERLMNHASIDKYRTGFTNRINNLREQTGRWLVEWLANPLPLPDPYKEPAPMPNPTGNDEVSLLVRRILELLIARHTTGLTTVNVAPPPAAQGIADPLAAQLLALLTGGKVPGLGADTPAPLGPVNGALGTAIGTLLNGRKTAIGLIGSALLGFLGQSGTGSIGAKLSTTVNSALPFLSGMSGPLLPVMLAMAVWGILGKVEKYTGGAPRR